MAVRPCTVADVPALAALEARCFADGWSAASVHNEITVAHGRAWLATAGEQPVGYVLGWLVGDEAQVNRVGVVPEMRGQGLGLRLVQTCLASLIDQGALTALLEVHADNEPALALYRRCGFAQVGRRKAYYSDGGDALVLRVALSTQDTCAGSAT